MKKSKVLKPVTYIKDIPIKYLPGANELIPGFIDLFDTFLVEWVESWLPYYKELKKRGADVFEDVITRPFGIIQLNITTEMEYTFYPNLHPFGERH